MAAFFAWLPIFLLQLFSSIFGMDLNNLPPLRTIEVLRWHQPVCTTAGPCYQSRQANLYEKVLNVRQVRTTIDIDEIEPSTIDTPEMFEKLYAPEYSDDRRAKRSYNGLYKYDHSLPIIVRRVIDSPVVATIVTRNCIDGVPSCDAPTRVPIKLPEEDYVLSRTIDALEEKKKSVYETLTDKKNAFVQAMSKATQEQREFVLAFVEKKQRALQEMVDEMKHKKDAVIQAFVDRTKSVIGIIDDIKRKIVDTFSHKKEAIVNAVSSAAAAKHDFVGNIIQKKKEKIQAAVDAVHEKKEQVVDAVSSAAAAKKQFFADLYQKKKDKIKAVADAVHEKKEQVVEAVSNAAVAKKEFVEAMIEKKKQTVQAAVDAVHKKKEQVVEAISNAATAKHEFVAGIIQSKKDKLKAVADAVHEKKEQVVEAISNAAAAKKEFVEGIIEKKKQKVQAAVDAVHDAKDKVVEVVSNAAAAKQQFVGGIIQGKKDKLQAVVDAVHEKKEQVVEAVSNAAAAKKEFVEGIIQSKKDKLQAAVDAVHDAAVAKHEKIKSIVNHKKEALNKFIEAKDKLEQDIALKKQQFVQHIADKKINAIKHISDKAQEYIGTASLIKPLVFSQAKQIFNKDKKTEDALEEKEEEVLEETRENKPEDQVEDKREEEVEDKPEDDAQKRIDEGSDFLFVDEEQKQQLANDDVQVDARTYGLFKDILKRKHKYLKKNNKTIQAPALIDAPNRPVSLTQQEAEKPTVTQDINNNNDAFDAIDSEETIEIMGPSTTEKIIATPESHVLPSFEEVPTEAEILEEAPSPSDKPEEPSTPIASPVNSTGNFEEATREETSSNAAESHVEVATKIDATVTNEQTVSSATTAPVIDEQAHSNNDTFTFGTELLWISKSKNGTVEAADVDEQFVAKKANSDVDQGFTVG